MDMSMLDMICVVASLAVVGMGYLEIKDGKLIGRKNIDDYTPESVAELAKKEGPLYIVIGFFGLIAGLSADLNILPNFLYWPALGLAIAGIVVDAVMIKKILKPKNKFGNIDLHQKLK